MESEAVKQPDAASLKDNLQAQLCELEMLQSMFPNPGEMRFDDNTALATLESYVSNHSDNSPPFIDFTINLTICETKFELCVNLSPDYPNITPDVYIRNSDLNKEQHARVNKNCAEYVSSLIIGDPYIFSIISWLQDNASDYLSDTSTSAAESSAGCKDELTRLWIYSHHIYNKTKRREILSLAADLKLTGFCMPGKPGVICVEGCATDCNSWWQAIRAMTWQRITCKVTEECRFPETFLKFKDFKEIGFQSTGARNHMDLGELFKFLNELGLGYIFKELFGVDGKES